MMGGDNQYRVSLFTAQFELKSVRLTIKMDTTSKIFAIVDWDDGTTNDIPLTVIRYPRKGLKDYAVGEKVEARCTGYGYCWGVLAAIDVDREYLKTKLLGQRPVVDDRKSENISTNKRKVETSSSDKPESSHKDMQLNADPILPVLKKPKTNTRKNTNKTKEKRKTKKKVTPKKKSIRHEMMDGNLNESSESETLVSSDEEMSDSILSPSALTSTPVSAKKVSSVCAIEGKKEKAEFNKKKRLIKKDREDVNAESSFHILEESSNIAGITSTACGCHDDLKTIDLKINKILELIEVFTNCKSCLKKAYKIACCGKKEEDNKETKKTLKGQEEIQKEKKQVEEITTKGSEEEIPKEKKKDVEVITTKGSEEEIVDDSADGSILQTDYNKDDDLSSAGEEELAYVGAAKYNVKLEKVILKRIIKTSKTPEKLALNLIAPLLSEYEINNCTLYGNQQHKKEAVAENKRRAIRSAVFDKFGGEKEQNEQLWTKLTININDKIRGLKNGKYKKQ